MKISVISDTHHEHDKFTTLSGDVLIHCGDMFNLFRANAREIEEMDAWFGGQDFDVVLCTGGNHDLSLERELEHNPRPFRNAVYLQDRVYVHDGVTFYGAPWTPLLIGHAFHRDAAGMKDAWSLIPAETDVLVTHTPPAGVLDVSSRGLQLGCGYLADAVSRIRPALHCFGHVHASAGEHREGGITFFNASSVNSQFRLTHEPRQFVL